MKTRDEYVNGLKKRLDAWNADMARWEEKAKDAQAEVKERYQRELDVLGAQRELARYNLRLLEGASTSAWKELARGADEAWERMQEAAEAARGCFEKFPAARKPGGAAKSAAKRGAKACH